MGPCGSKKPKRETLKPKQEIIFKQQQPPTKPMMVKSEVKEEIENVPPEYQKLSKTQKPQQIILPSLLIQQDQAPHNHMQVNKIILNKKKSILKRVNPQNNLEISIPIRYEQGYKVEIRGKQQ